MKMVTQTTSMTFNCRLPSKMILNISDTIELRPNLKAQGPLQRNPSKSGSGWPSSRPGMSRRSSETHWRFPESRAVPSRTLTSRPREGISRNQKIGKEIRMHRAHRTTSQSFCWDHLKQESRPSAARSSTRWAKSRKQKSTSASNCRRYTRKVRKICVLTRSPEKIHQANGYNI